MHRFVPKKIISNNDREIEIESERDRQTDRERGERERRRKREKGRGREGKGGKGLNFQRDCNYGASDVESGTPLSPRKWRLRGSLCVGQCRNTIQVLSNCSQIERIYCEKGCEGSIISYSALIVTFQRSCVQTRSERFIHYFAWEVASSSLSSSSAYISATNARSAVSLAHSNARFPSRVRCKFMDDRR